MKKSLRTTMATLCLSSVAFATDPVPPAGGWPTQSALDVGIQWSDNYRTRIDVYWPDATAIAAPPSGWPAVLVVHGGGRSRKVGWAQTTMKKLASLGYVAFGYDVRGDGVTPRLNPTWGRNKGTQSRLLADVAECFRRIETQRPQLVDESRLGIYGQSQGGGHAYRSAAYSGRTIPGMNTQMPILKAAVGDIQVFDVLEDATPMATMFTTDAILGSAERRTQFPAFWNAVRADNPTAFRTAFAAMPGQVYLSALHTSRVPLLVMNSWDDSNHVVNTNADDFASLRPGVPHRFFLTTGGHASAANDIENAQGLEMLCRWFDRFLKSRNNDIAKQPFAEVAVIPNQTSEYLDAKSAWKHRQIAQWPIVANRTSFYLHDNKAMKRSQFTGSTEVRVLHQVRAGYDAEAFAKDGGKIQNVIKSIAPNLTHFETAASPDPVELTGRSTFQADVTPSAANFQLVATLYDVDASGRKRYITSGVTGVRGASTNRMSIAITLADVSYVMPAGHSFRLELKNLHVREHPGNVHLYTAPFFSPYRVRIHIDGASDPRLVLPLRAPMVSMTPRIASESAAAGIAHSLPVNGSTLRAGDLYLTLMSASGTAPGIPTMPRIPVNADSWTNLGLALMNTPVLPAWVGLLDAKGKATPRFLVPPALSKALAGTRLSFTTLVFQPNGSFEVSNPVTMRIEN